jgi:hypothetical protein
MASLTNTLPRLPHLTFQGGGIQLRWCYRVKDLDYDWSLARMTKQPS